MQHHWLKNAEDRIWRANGKKLQIPIKTKKDNDYFEARLIWESGQQFSVLLINGENNKIHIDSLLKMESLLDWHLKCLALDSEMSKLMQKRENWYGNESKWAIISRERKVISSGSGMPNESDILNALEQVGIQNPVDALRKFIRENPNHIGAKEELLDHLNKIVFEKTKAKIGEKFLRDFKVELSPEDDLVIWSEYASLFRQLVQYYTNNPPTWFSRWITSRYDRSGYGDMYNYSPSMKAIFKDSLPPVTQALRKFTPSMHIHLYLDMYILLFDRTSNTQFSDLLETMVYSPLDNPLYSPLLNISDCVAGKYQKHENWHGVVSVLEPFWDWSLSGGVNDFNNVVRYKWQLEKSAIPLIEAYLALKQKTKLKEWIGACKKSPFWKELEPDVIKLFEKYDENYLSF